MRDFKYYDEERCEDKRKNHCCKCEEKYKEHRCKYDDEYKNHRCKSEDNRKEYRCKCEDKRKDNDKFKPMVLTTGVLNTVVGQTAAHIEIANLDPVETFQARVQVINWNSGSPVVLLNQLVNLLPNRHVILTQNVAPFHYEAKSFIPEVRM